DARLVAVRILAPNLAVSRMGYDIHLFATSDVRSAVDRGALRGVRRLNFAALLHLPSVGVGLADNVNILLRHSLVSWLSYGFAFRCWVRRGTLGNREVDRLR